MAGITYVPLFTYEALLAVANQHPLAGKPFVVAEDLQKETLITYPVERDRLDIFTRFLEPADVEPAQVRTAEMTMMMMQLVASGRGVGADPRRAWVWARLAADAGAGTGVAVEAGSLADGLARRFSAPTLAELKAERAAWRSWP